MKYFYDEQLLKENTTKTLNSSLLCYTSPIQAQTNFLSNNKSSHSSTIQANNSTDTVLLSDAMIKECNNLIDNFNNPYLKALFNYILNREDSVAKILVSF